MVRPALRVVKEILETLVLPAPPVQSVIPVRKVLQVRKVYREQLAQPEHRVTLVPSVQRVHKGRLAPLELTLLFLVPQVPLARRVFKVFRVTLAQQEPPVQLVARAIRGLLVPLVPRVYKG